MMKRLISYSAMLLPLIVMTGCTASYTPPTDSRRVQEPQQAVLDQSESEKKDIEVRRNMERLQNACEAYAKDHHGKYPVELDQTFKSYIYKACDAKPEGNMEDGPLVNPFNGKHEWPYAGMVEDVLHARAAYPEAAYIGTVQHSSIGDGQSYAITGGGSNGKQLGSYYRGSGGTLVLSNVNSLSQIPHHSTMRLTIKEDPDGNELSGISPLVGLDIKYVRATDAVVYRLNGMENIEKLDLSQTGITREAIQPLSTLSSLNSLDLSETNIADANLEYLSFNPQLKKLSLRRTVVGKDTLKNLTTLRDLRELDVRDTKITQFGLAEIANMPRLEVLFLSGKLNAADVTHLMTKPTKSLNLDTALDPAVFKKLQQSIPGRKISIAR